MATPTEIANFALGHVGQGRITSMDLDNEPARVCKLWYNTARRETLAMANWTCASKRIEIPADAETPAYGFANQYLKPADFVRLVKINGVGRGIEWTIEGRYILCDLAAPLQVKYVFDLEDTSQYDDYLVQTMALTLASYISPKLDQSRTRTSDLLERAEAKAKAAKNVDTSGNSPQELEPGSWQRR